MIIKDVNLETVCGITSTAAGKYTAGIRVCRQIKRRQIVP